VSPALRLLIIMGVAFALHACSFLPSHGTSLPVDASDFGNVLPDGYELHAVLTLERAGVSREYLMVVSTEPGEARLALMTPQGLPIYLMTGSEGSLTVSQQLRFEHLLTPNTVASYLLMIYGGSELLLDSAAGSDWQLEVASQRRSYSPRAGGGGTIEVSYRGEAPWYSEVTLIDSRDGTLMIVRTLEWFDVIPE
jgi:hypothetical protein